MKSIKPDEKTRTAAAADSAKPAENAAAKEEEPEPRAAAVSNWMGAFPASKCWLKAFAPDDTEQEVELTTGEYDALKHHLAKLRGLVPDGGTNELGARSPSAESADPELDPTAPGALTVARLIAIHEDSIGILKNKVRLAVKFANEGSLRKGDLIGDALDAELLSDMLQLWDTGGCGDDPLEGRLASVIKSRFAV
jgi:hypothetical protein